MKKLGILFVVALLAMSVVSATETTLDDDSLTMDYTDVQQVEFCIYEGGVPQNVNVGVNPICKDLNSLIGCSAGDEYDPAGFSVVPDEATTGADGCVMLTITTTLTPEQAGKFYYTVNGMIGETTIGSETGTVFVPEFGVLAAALVLGAAGLYIYKRRK